MRNSREIFAANAQALVKQLKAKGRKQEALAAVAEMSPSQFSQALRAANSPSLEIIDRIAVALGTTAGRLLSEQDPHEGVAIEECVRRVSDAVRENEKRRRLEENSFARKLMAMTEAEAVQYLRELHLPSVTNEK